MSDKASEEAPTGVPVPDHYGFYLERGKDLRKQTLPLLNDVLSKLVVLDTALIGTFLSLKDLPVAGVVRAIAATCFILSLLLAVIGVFPKQDAIRLQDAEGIKESEDKAIACKRWLLCWAVGLLLAGFAFGVVGLWSAAINSDPAFSPPTK